MGLVAEAGARAVTFTTTMQPPGGIEVPFATLKLRPPLVAVPPAHVPVLPAVLIVIPAGNASVNAAVSVMALALPLPSVTVRLVLPPAAMLAAANDLETVGAPSTVSTTPVAAVPVSATGPVAVGAPVAMVLLRVAVT